MPALVEDVAKILAVNATVLPRGALRNFPWLNQVEQRDGDHITNTLPYAELQVLTD